MNRESAGFRPEHARNRGGVSCSRSSLRATAIRRVWAASRWSRCASTRTDTRPSRRMHKGIVRSPHFHPRHDLRAGGDVVTVVRHRLERAWSGLFRRARIRGAYSSVVRAGAAAKEWPAVHERHRRQVVQPRNSSQSAIPGALRMSAVTGSSCGARGTLSSLRPASCGRRSALRWFTSFADQTRFSHAS